MRVTVSFAKGVGELAISPKKIPLSNSYRHTEASGMLKQFLKTIWRGKLETSGISKEEEASRENNRAPETLPTFPTQMHSKKPPDPKLVQSAPTSFTKQISHTFIPSPGQRNRRTISPAKMHERRAKGLCYFCNEKFTPGHKCTLASIVCVGRRDYEEMEEE